MTGPDEGNLTRVIARTHWRKDDAQVVVDAWRESGLSQAQFSRTHGVHAMRLARWARRLGRPATEFREVRVRLPEWTGTVEPRIEIVLRGCRTIRVPPSFAADDLRRVLEIVERV